MRLFLLFVLFFLLSAFTVAQSPTHFKIGEDFFSNSDIYSILETDDNRLYVASNDGVFTYQYNEFQKLPSTSLQKGNSFFSLKSNSKGEVFCHNLQGQIFKIINNKLTLYYELASEDLDNDLKYFFDSKDNLLIFSRNFIKLNSKLEKETILRVKKVKGLLVRPMQMIDGTIICTYCLDNEDLFLIYKNNQLEIKKYNEIQSKNEEGKMKGSLAGYIFNNQLIYATEFNEFSNTFPVKKLNNNRRKVFQISSDLLFSLDFKKGCNFWSLKGNTLVQNKTLFPYTFISTHYYNKGGTLFLGTFGEGIIVVPSINSIEEEINSSLRGIDVNNGKTIIGSRDGILYEYKDSLVKVAERNLNLDEVFALKNSYSFLPEPDVVTSHGSMTSFPIVKDVFESDLGFFLATNNGLYYASEDLYNQEISPFKLHTTRDDVLHIYGKTRFSSIAYSSKYNEIYFSDFNKVHCIKENNKPKELLYKGASIYCNDLTTYNNNLIIATPENGILSFINHQFNFNLTTNNGLTSNNIKKIKVVGDWLYILTKESIQVYDFKKNQLITLGSENGVIDNLITDFSADETNLWLLKSKSFIRIPTQTFNFKKQVFGFSIDSVKSDNELIDHSNAFSLNHTQKNISLYINFNDIVRSRDALLQIKIDNQVWKSYSAIQNKIDVENFGPGNHNLMIRLKYGNEFYDEQILNFKQFPPFYQRWWFYPILILLTAIIIIIIFKRKLKSQAKESRRVNELNSSKLRAIQSQMNPHFIFNALNSIQYLVISGATDSAYNYITRFANLVRRTLDYSDRETISIYEEIELLEVYLEIEKLRFQEDFEYEIIKRKVREVKVPPMLVQPFIENALIHGLLHKEGKKRLVLTIEVLEDIVLCTLEDNGIGRVEAKKIKTRQKGDHKSFALNAITNRFRILSEHYNKELGYEYQDFTPNRDVVTRVILRIPIDKK